MIEQKREDAQAHRGCCEEEEKTMEPINEEQCKKLAETQEGEGPSIVRRSWRW